MIDLERLQGSGTDLLATLVTDQNNLGTDLRNHTLDTEARSGDQPAIGDYVPGSRRERGEEGRGRVALVPIC